MDLGLSILPSRSFLGIGSLVFSETHHGLEAHMVLCVTAGFLGKKILSQKWGKWAKNRVF